MADGGADLLGTVGSAATVRGSTIRSGPALQGSVRNGTTKGGLTEMPAPITTPTRDTGVLTGEDQQSDTPWITLLLDDPVTTFGYVIATLQLLFSFDRVTAERLTHQVHHEGKAVVFSGSLEDAESACLKLLSAGLRSRFEQAGGS